MVTILTSAAAPARDASNTTRAAMTISTCLARLAITTIKTGFVGAIGLCRHNLLIGHSHYFVKCHFKP